MSKKESETLKEVFEARKATPFCFIRQGGNQGDNMIYEGACKLAYDVGLNYREIMGYKPSRVESIRKGEIIYVHGGGGFCTWWNWTPRLLHQLDKDYPDNLIIVGPSSVALQDWYLKKWLPKRRNLIFFAREYTSFNYLKDNFYPDVKLDHDTGMYLKVGDTRLVIVLHGEPIKKMRKVCCLREDPESSNTIPEEVAKRIDAGYFHQVVDPCQTNEWGKIHASACEIWTNRSHSAILGAALGTRTYMFAGAYHKNRSIYEYSLKKKGVKWVK